jgi:hypothetical protein
LVALLFLVGVIYPLSFLPMPTDSTPQLSAAAFLALVLSLRGGLLVAISVIFIFILGVLFVLNARMRYPSADVASLK